jgi:hypothetical protein
VLFGGLFEENVQNAQALEICDTNSVYREELIWPGDHSLLLSLGCRMALSFYRLLQWLVMQLKISIIRQHFG